MKLKHLGQLLRSPHGVLAMRAHVLYGRPTPLAASGRAVWRTGLKSNGYDYLRLSDDYVVTRADERS